MKRILFCICCVLAVALLCGCQKKPLYSDTQIMMGTFVEVISPEKGASSIVFDEIRRIEGHLSKYKEDSDIAKLNRLGRLRVSPDTMAVLIEANKFWNLSGGEFDVTVGPLLDLWGFRDKQYRLPTEEEIRRTLRLVGFDKIVFNTKNNVVELKLSRMQIDLGAIAKGYAVDQAVRQLRYLGFKSCLINAGGQIYCLGDKFGKPWRVGIRNPRNNGIIQYLKLRDSAVSTSGDYEQYFMIGNKRYSHILNPKTGYPVDSGIISATVIAPSGLTADALSTSIFLLGKAKGLRLAKQFKGVKVKIVEKKNVWNRQ